MENFGITYAIGSLCKELVFFEDLDNLLVSLGFLEGDFFRSRVKSRDICSFIFSGEKLSLTEEDFFWEGEDYTVAASVYAIEYGLVAFLNISLKDFLTDEFCKKSSVDMVLSQIKSPYFCYVFAKGLAEEAYHKSIFQIREDTAIRIDSFFRTLVPNEVFDISFKEFEFKDINIALSSILFHKERKTSSLFLFLSDSQKENKITDEGVLGERTELFFLVGYLASCLPYLYFLVENLKKLKQNKKRDRKIISDPFFAVVGDVLLDIELVLSDLRKELKYAPANNLDDFVFEVLWKFEKSKKLLQSF